MERIERWLAISMALLAVFASALLGMGQGEMVRPLVMLAAAVMAVYFTDLKKVFYLNRLVANVAALGAVAMSLYDFARFDRDHQLLAIANLLIYLQIVVLFQQKNVRIYWQLVMLSLLQVVVAAALNFSIIFGVLLVVYLFLALVTLTIFFVYRESTAHLPESSSDESSEFTQTGIAGVRHTALAPQQAPRSRDLDALAPRMGVFRTSSAMGVLTLLVTIVIFLAVPRFGNSAWRGGGASAGRTVGFSQKVTLGALGDVIENPDIVMRVQFIDDRTGAPLRLRNEPLFRGSVVTTYAHQQWSHRRRSYRRTVEPLPPPQTRQNLVRQLITLEPLDEPVVFSVFPSYQLDDDYFVAYDRERDQLVRPGRMQHTQISFELGTTGIRDGLQHPFMAETEPISPFEYRQLLQLPTAPATGGRDPLEGLKHTADRIVERAQIPRDDHFLVAHTLQAYLQATGGFKYSLRGQRRDPQLDAVEDFVTNHRVGHCEYFASALVLMLRSQGVPARLVLGFKGGEYNPIGNFYVVRQLHAHAWVEAYLAPETLASRNFENGADLSYGGWLRLDPTTSASDDDELSAATGVLAQFGQVFDYVEMLWVSNVVGMTSNQQQRVIYDPLTTNAAELLRSFLGDPGQRQPLMTRVAGIFRSIWTWLQGNWFSWKGGLVAMGVSLVLVGLYRLLASWVAAMRRWLQRRQHTASRTRVEFYQRLENLLAGYGYQRPPGQTHREFAMATGGQLAETPQLRQAAPLPRRLVDVFYRVRFGHHELSTSEAEEISRTLEELERMLAQPGQA